MFLGHVLDDTSADTDRVIIESVASLAQKYDVKRSQIVLTWLLQKEPVAAPIIGATKTSHLESEANALSVKLTSEDITFLEVAYVPYRILGHQ